MQTTIQVRFADAADYATLAEVMFDAVRHGPSRYSEAQRRAWVPMVRSGEQWERRLATQQVFVASQSTQTLGFISLAAKGYVDFAYVQPSAQRMGVFRRLYESLERFAADAGEPRLWAHASLMAQPAFAAVGFRAIKEETVQIDDQVLRRFEMEKQIDGLITKATRNTRIGETRDP